MFDPLRDEALDRFFAIRVYSGECKANLNGRSNALAKGLVFVQNYAAYEYTVVSAVQTAMNCVTGYGIGMQELRSSLLAIALDAELASITSVPRRKSWAKRVKLFQKAISGDAAVLTECSFPDDGGHFRYSQLQTLWQLFDLPSPAMPEGRLIGRIDEMVEHRNAITHGRDTADRIGGRYSDGEIESRIDDIEAACMHITAAFADHCSSSANLTR